MSKPANKTLIGAFVVGAVVLTVAAIVLFGSGRFFKDTNKWVAFFPGSVRGLNVGSPVVFRGVQVGQVTEIIVNFDADELSVSIPVIFETDPERFRDVGDRVFTDDKEVHRALVEQGLRAQLQLTSLVTGQLAINMDFYPDTAAKLFGVENARLSDDVRDWQEIPTISTTLQDLEQALAQIDFKDMAEDFKRAMDGIAKLVSSPELQASVSELKETLIAVKTLARDMDSKIEPLATSLDQTLVDVRAGIGDARKLIASVDERATPLMSKIQNAVESAQGALDQANQTLTSLEQIAEEGTQLRYEVSATLREISAASRSVRVLSDFIEQHPDAVLRGRATGTGGN
ncbi:MAG: MlaD family protein [Desulfobacterales bacterium]|jgi:paraquat-inducible protein B